MKSHFTVRLVCVLWRAGPLTGQLVFACCLPSHFYEAYAIILKLFDGKCVWLLGRATKRVLGACDKYFDGDFQINTTF